MNQKSNSFNILTSQNFD